MNTFLNYQQDKFVELSIAQIRTILNKPLNQKINERGGYEQYYALLLTHYPQGALAKKRLCKGTCASGGEFINRYQ